MIIIDNFLKLEDLNEICSIPLKTIARDKINFYHNSIDINKNLKNDCFNPKLLNRLHKNYHSKAINLLKELNPLKVKLYDYSEFDLIETGADYQFPIHDDIPDKLLSGVIYIKPEKNTGTIFYKNKKILNENSHSLWW